MKLFKRWNPSLVDGFIAVITSIMITVVVRMHFSKANFSATVQTGMSRVDVLRSLGQPIEQYQPGEVMAHWGTTPQNELRDETWVYSVYPPWMLHGVVSFRNGKVSEVNFYSN